MTLSRMAYRQYKTKLLVNEKYVSHAMIILVSRGFLRFHLAAHSQILSALPNTGRFIGGHVGCAPFIDCIPNVTVIRVM